MVHIAFIIDGRKKNADKIFQSFERYFGHAHKIKKFITAYGGNAVQLAEQALNEGFNWLICIGGDGCLNEVANGMMKVRQKMSNEEWSEVRLGVLPMGSGNDFARTANAPDTFEKLVQAIEEDKNKLIDLGMVHYLSISGEMQYRYFINIADIGIGAVVVQKQSAYAKRMGALFNYQRAILSTFLTYKKHPVRVKTENFEYEGNVIDVVVANGKFYGNGLGIAPDAELDDGIFSLVVLGNISLFDYLMNLNKARKCVKINFPDLHYKTAIETHVDALSGKTPIEIDGEFIGYSPVTIRVVPGSIRVLC